MKIETEREAREQSFKLKKRGGRGGLFTNEHKRTNNIQLINYVKDRKKDNYRNLLPTFTSQITIKNIFITKISNRHNQLTKSQQRVRYSPELN